jgi:cyclase
MANVRIIPRLDIKGSNLIKGVHLEGLRVIGDPYKYALRYYESGADELIYMDTVASLYGRNNLTEILEKTVNDVFIPVTAGGGIRSVDDVSEVLRSGADKVAVNTAAIGRPQLIDEISRKFGSQCMVLSIEAKTNSFGGWDALTDNGRENTGKNAIDWAIEGVERGAGEILLTSVDKEGTRSGFDQELVQQITESVSVPVIVSGGMGSLQHFTDVILNSGAQAVAIADALHFDRMDLIEIRETALKASINVRRLA